MAEDTNARQEPPLVLQAAAVPSEMNPPLVILIASKPHPGFLEAIAWCLVFLFTQFLSLCLITLIVFLAFALSHRDVKEFLFDQMDRVAKSNEKQSDQTETPEFPTELGHALAYGMLGAPIASLGLILLVLPRRIGKDWQRQIGLCAPSLLHVMLIVLLAPGFILAANGIQELLQKEVGITVPTVGKGLTKTFGSFPWFLTFLAIGFGPGLVEEIWCRGFLGRGLTARYGLVVGVILTSILFGLMHCSITYAIPVTIMGLYLHFVYLVSQSIWISILLHTLNNSIGVLLSLSGWDDLLDAKIGGRVGIVYLVSVSLILFASIALWTSCPRVVPLHPAEKQIRSKVSPLAICFTLTSFAVLMFLLFW